MHAMIRAMGTLAFVLCTTSLGAQDIPYIGSSSGYVLHSNGGGAVVANWNGQAPIQGFTGYGQIRMDGLCLTGRNGQQQLRWESCKGGDKSQIWAISNKRLNNELGWCADVEGNRQGPNVRVLAWQCSGAINQQWNDFRAVSLQSVLSRITDATIRAGIEAKIRNARPGFKVQLTERESAAIIAAGGLNLIAAGGQNLVGRQLISDGGQYLINLDAGTFKVLSKQ